MIIFQFLINVLFSEILLANGYSEIEGWNFLVSLNRKHGIGLFEFICNGNAITKDFALTSKRCLENKSKEEIKIKSGVEQCHLFATEMHNVLKFFSPKSKSKSKPIDLALLKVKRLNSE